MKSPADPASWKRVYAGSVLSAVLVTQLDGDFAGPVIGQVAIPFYSADRQRILAPREGAAARFGAGRRAAGPGAARGRFPPPRLARRRLGRSSRPRLERHRRERARRPGEPALRVDVRGGRRRGPPGRAEATGLGPYAGGGAGLRAAAGQGFGQSATQILGRFLNRLPTITIRAGHRLRV